MSYKLEVLGGPSNVRLSDFIAFLDLHTFFRGPCKHSFSKESILDYLRNSTKKCPAAGCNRMLRAGDLVEDADLAKRAKEAARREARRREQADDIADEVVDDDD